MTGNNSNAEMNKYLFINLVTMLSLTAMQQLGKIIPGRAGNPAVGKADVNLEAAQATIDTLDMLFTKTGGNLDNDEARLLKDTLATLKMNYVETRDMEMKNASAVAQPGSAEGFAEARASSVAKTAMEDKMADAPRGMKNEKPQDKMPPDEPKDTAPKSEPQAQERPEPKSDSRQANDPKFHKSYS